MRVRSKCVLFIVVLLMASAVGAQTFTKNQNVQPGAAPAVIPINYDSSPPPVLQYALGAPLNIAYGVQVAANNVGTSPVTMTINTPPAFVPTAIHCVKFPGGSTTGVPLGMPCTLGLLPSLPIGPLSVPNDKVIIVVDGYFKGAGAFGINFTAARDNITEATNISVSAAVQQVAVDLAITKEVKPKGSGAFGSTASIAFGGTVTYRLTVKNLSAPDPLHKTDVYLGPLLTVADTLSTPGTNDVPVTVTPQAVQCTPSGGADCVATTTPGAVTLSAGSGQSLFAFKYPAGSNGFLPAGASFEITFDAVMTTSAACSPGQDNKVLNGGHITFSNGTATVADADPSNNTASPVTVKLTGLPPTGCTGGGGGIPSIGIKKALVSVSTGTPQWGATFTYEITITNTTAQTLIGLGVSDVLSGLPPFTATLAASNAVCTPACMTPPLSVTQPVTQFNTGLFTAKFAPLAAGGVQVLRYDVKYDAPCSDDGKAGSITNTAALTGPANGSDSVATAMPALPVCSLTTTKAQTSGPASFSSYPVTLGYKVEFKNNSPTQSVRVGTIVDAMAFDSAAYGVNIPITYSYTCTAPGITMPSGAQLSQTNVSTLVKPNNPLITGLRLIDFSNYPGIVFPPSSAITCNLTVTVNQPPADDSLCQGAGPANLVNNAFMDLLPFFNTNQSKPAFAAPPVITPLPKCVSILVAKTVSTPVFAGGPVTFTLTVKNVGNDPVSNLTLNDLVPSDFTNVTWSCGSGCTPPNGTGNSVTAALPTIAAGATLTLTIQATAPTKLGSYCNETQATFKPFPPLTFFEGDQTTLTKAQACLQVEPPPEPGKPKLSKSFDPGTIGPGGSAVLTFTITNSAGDPKQTGIAFSDTLPPELVIDSVVTNGCAGTVTISTDGHTVTLAGGQLVGSNSDGSGKHTCTIAVKVKATGVCGSFPNSSKNFSRVENLDVEGIDQHIDVTGCSEGLVVKKNVVGAPAGFSGQFSFLVQCATPNGLVQQVVTVNWPVPGFTTVTGIPAGSTCTVTEGTPPSPPAGFNWNALPVYTPPSIVTTDKGGVLTVEDRMSPCKERGQVTIKKVVKGLPANFTGTFQGTLQCWVNGTLTSTPVTLTSPGGLTATVNNIPLGSTCTFQETGQPALSGGLQWNPPVYAPPFGTVTLIEGCCKEIVVTNEARQCCDAPGVPLCIGPDTTKGVLVPGR